MTPETVNLTSPALLPPASFPLGPTPNTRAPVAERLPTALGLIVLGRDEQGRSHASAFDIAEAEAAIRAASLMGMHTLTVSEEHRALAASLARGRLFASGKAFVPFCADGVFARLLAIAGLPDMPKPLTAASKAASTRPPAGPQAGGVGGTDGSGGAPSDWASIGIGSVVLACQGPMEGWWEAVVTHTKADDRFVLRWRDFPDDGEITRARKDLGLLPPGSREGLS